MMSPALWLVQALLIRWKFQRDMHYVTGWESLDSTQEGSSSSRCSNRLAFSRVCECVSVCTLRYFSFPSSQCFHQYFKVRTEAYRFFLRCVVVNDFRCCRSGRPDGRLREKKKKSSIANMTVVRTAWVLRVKLWGAELPNHPLNYARNLDCGGWQQVSSSVAAYRSLFGGSVCRRFIHSGQGRVTIEALASS